MSMVERLAKRYRERVNERAKEALYTTEKIETRWWLNAIAAELDNWASEVEGGPGPIRRLAQAHAIRQVASWLRNQAKEGDK